MKIGLISPKGNFFSNKKQFQNFLNQNKIMSNYLSIFSGISPALLILASLTPKSYTIEIIDENIENVDFTKQYNLIGITAMTQQATRAYEIADTFRKKNIKIIIGGIHATILPDEAKQHVDSVVIGEAEYIWPKLLDDFQNNKLQSFYKSDTIVNLKDSPIPRYDLLKSKNYKTFWVQTTRGCPHDCEFCAATKIFGNKFRTKSVNQVINEIKFIKKNNDNFRISFSDDNFLVNKKFSIDFLNKLIPLKIRYLAQSDISIAKYDNLLSLLKKSGCTFLLIGFESTSKSSLKKIDKFGWKNRFFNNYSDSIKKIQSFGIGVQGAFIIGLDNDDISIIKKTTNFIIKNKLYESQITISTPLPGTRLREKIVKENRLLNTSWSNYTCCDVNFIHPKLSKNEMENGLLNIYKSINTKEVYLNKIKYFKKIHKKLIQNESS